MKKLFENTTIGRKAKTRQPEMVEDVKERDFRSSGRWQNLRELRISKHPVCEVCNDSLSEEVHHVYQVMDRPDLIFDIDNLRSVCKSCHYKVHGAYRRGYSPEKLFGVKL